MKKNAWDYEALKNIFLISQIGITFLFPTFVFLGIGMWLDKSYGINITLILLIVGMAVGFRSDYVLIRNQMKPSDNEKTKQEEKRYIDEVTKQWEEGRIRESDRRSNK